MKFAIVFFAIVAVAASAAVDPAANAAAQTLKSEQVVNPDSYNYAYETSNGIQAQEQGQLKQIGEESGIVAQGSYSYVADDGQTYTVTYIADENGFQPQGAHLPVAPVA